MPTSLIIYGPQGCGKTRNKARLARHFGLTSTKDDWAPGQPFPTGNCLVLAIEDPRHLQRVNPAEPMTDQEIKAKNHSRVLSFREAMRQAGLTS